MIKPIAFVRPLIILVGSSLLLGAQCEPIGEAVNVTNRTDEIVLIYREDSKGKVHQLEGIGPGETQAIGTPDQSSDPDGDPRCTKLTYIAKTQSGEVIERKTSPTCEGDEWAIEQP